MKEINQYIRRKKRKKALKRFFLSSIILVICAIIFFTKMPIFNVAEIEIEGVVTVSKSALLDKVNNRIGENIFVLNRKSMKKDLMENKYIKDVDIKQDGINKLKVLISEEAPVYYIKNGDIIQIINNNLDILETVNSIEDRSLVQVMGISLDEINKEENKDEKDACIKILSEFYPFISENKEELKLNGLNINNVVDIRGYIGEVEIFFGDETNLVNKMENVYRIMLSENINLKKGYINVSIDGSPIIKNYDSGGGE